MLPNCRASFHIFALPFGAYVSSRVVPPGSAFLIMCTPREELRVYNGEIRDMNMLLKEVETAKTDVQSQVDKLKISAKEDAKKRMEDLKRRQAKVEKMLADTKEKAEELKVAQKKEDDEV